MVEGKVPLNLSGIKISLISLFELQAKAAKLNIPVERVIKAIEAIEKAFTIIPFTKPEIIRASFLLKKNTS